MREQGFLLEKISVGDAHACVINSNGGVVCWGNGGSGRLGNNNSVDQDHPVAVVGLDRDGDNNGDDLLGDIVQVSAGEAHTCALKSNGRVVCWGDGDDGHLGNNELMGKDYPVAVVGEDSDDDDNGDGFLSEIVQISAGAEHTCALQSNGGVVCWGHGGDGRLGNDAVVVKHHPVAVVGEDSDGNGSGDGLLGNIVQISAGGQHTCALKSDGGMVCWGSGIVGRLGHNGTSSRGHPVAVVGEDSDNDNNGDDFLNGIIGISAGEFHTCALKSDGVVRCWGYGDSGRLGNDDTANFDYPIAVVGEDSDNDDNGNNSLSGILQIDIGNSHSCAIRSDKSAVCWGHGGDGRLGNDDVASKDHPVAVVGEDGDDDDNGNGLLVDVVQVGPGGAHTCALKLDGGVVCWGDGRNGRLGAADTADKDHPVAVVNSATSVAPLNVGTTLTGYRCLSFANSMKCSLVESVEDLLEQATPEEEGTES